MKYKCGTDRNGEPLACHTCKYEDNDFNCLECTECVELLCTDKVACEKCRWIVREDRVE